MSSSLLPTSEKANRREYCEWNTGPEESALLITKSLSIGLDHLVQPKPPANQLSHAAQHHHASAHPLCWGSHTPPTGNLPALPFSINEELQQQYVGSEELTALSN